MTPSSSLNPLYPMYHIAEPSSIRAPAQGQSSKVQKPK